MKLRLKKTPNNCHITAECKSTHNICLWSSQQVQGVVQTGLRLLLSTAFCPRLRYLLLFNSVHVLGLRSQLVTQRKPFPWIVFTSPKLFLVYPRTRLAKCSFVILHTGLNTRHYCYETAMTMTVTGMALSL